MRRIVQDIQVRVAIGRSLVDISPGPVDVRVGGGRSSRLLAAFEEKEQE
jgi:hypothetical protein